MNGALVMLRGSFTTSSSHDATMKGWLVKKIGEATAHAECEGPYNDVRPTKRLAFVELLLVLTGVVRLWSLSP